MRVFRSLFRHQWSVREVQAGFENSVQILYLIQDAESCLERDVSGGSSETVQESQREGELEIVSIGSLSESYARLDKKPNNTSNMDNCRLPP